MRRHTFNFKALAVMGILAGLILSATTAEARRGRGRGSDDIATHTDDHGRDMDDSPDVQIDAASFFAACPNVMVTRETVVNGQAGVVGDCTITVTGNNNLDLLEVDLTVMGNLTIQGNGDVDVSIGDENCPDGQICAGSDIRATGLRIDLTGSDSRARVFFSRVEADTIDIVASGTDAEVRAHNSTLDATAYIVLVATGTDARTRIDVVNEWIDRNNLSANTVMIESGGSRAETRVDDTDFQAGRVTISSFGEARAERNHFGGASVAVSGGDDCRSRDNVPDVSCN